MKSAGGASMQHSGLDNFDYSAESLTQASSNNSEYVGTVETSLGKRGRRSELKSTRQIKGLNQSGFNNESHVYDDRLLANHGPQRLLGLSMKVGKRLGHLDSITPFLGNLHQHGKVKSSWNGALTSSLNERSVFMMCFRHRLSRDDTASSTDGNCHQVPYPGSTSGTTTGTGTPKVLFPNSVGNVVYQADINGPASVLDGTTQIFDKINNSFYQHSTGDVCFVPINRPDLEDMSWNLNKLKLAPIHYGLSGVQPQLGTVPVFEIGKHRRQSILQQNNFQKVITDRLGPGVPSAQSTTGTTAYQTSQAMVAPYIYKPVLRYGQVSYEFRNKNDTGCTVEVIVYRFKKTANMSALASSYKAATGLIQSTTDNPVAAYYPLNKLCDAASQGYFNTVGDKYATENLAGRQPSRNDIYTNPGFPLLPNLRKTVASAMPVAEVMRNKFAMTAGSRRNVVVHFPGEVYNPCNIRTSDIEVKRPTISATPALTDELIASSPFGPQLRSHQIPILDEYSYAVVIAVNGQKMTRFFDNKPTSGTSFCQTGIASLPSTIFPPYPAAGGDGYGIIVMSSVGQGPWNDPDTLYFRNNENAQIQHSINGIYNYIMILPVGVPTTDQVCCMRFKCVTFNPLAPNPLGVDCFTEIKTIQFYSIQQGLYYGPKRGCDFQITLPNQTAYTYDVVFNTGSTNFVYDPLTCLPLNCRVVINGVNTMRPVSMWVFSNDGQPPASATAPNSVIMGDNYGHADIDYSATYTEHLSACLYETPRERNLYDCGQPDEPSLEEGCTDDTTPVCTGSTEQSRIIMPAVKTMRQSAGYTAGLGTDGNPNSLNYEFPHNSVGSQNPTAST